MQIALAALLCVSGAYLLAAIIWHSYLGLTDQQLHDEERSLWKLLGGVLGFDFPQIGRSLRAMFPYGVHRWGDELIAFQVIGCLGALIGSVACGFLIGPDSALLCGIWGAGIGCFLPFGLSMIGVILMNIF